MASATTVIGNNNFKQMPNNNRRMNNQQQQQLLINNNATRTFRTQQDFITGNDRRFTCGYGECGNAADFRANGALPNNMYNFDFTLFNVQALRDNLDASFQSLKIARDELINWIELSENDVAFKVNAGVIPRDASLFNKLTNVVPRINKFKRLINAWFVSTQDLVYELSATLTNYDNISIKLQMLGVNPTVTYNTLTDNVVAIARKNLSRSKSIQQQTNKLIVVDAKIRDLLVKLQNKNNEFSSGMLKYSEENTVLDLKEVVNVINSLGGKDSPLVALQKSLSETLNAQPIRFRIDTPDVNLLTPVPGIPDLGRNLPGPDEIIRILQSVKNSFLYTKSTKIQLEPIEGYIRELRDTPRYDEFVIILQDIIENNTPNRLFQELRRQASEPEGIYLLLDRINSLRRNLQPEDAIYRPALDEIYTIAASTAEREIQNQTGVIISNRRDDDILLLNQNDELMDVDDNTITPDNNNTRNNADGINLIQRTQSSTSRTSNNNNTSTNNMMDFDENNDNDNEQQLPPLPVTSSDEEDNNTVVTEGVVNNNNNTTAILGDFSEYENSDFDDDDDDNVDDANATTTTTEENGENQQSSAVRRITTTASANRSTTAINRRRSRSRSRSRSPFNNNNTNNDNALETDAAADDDDISNIGSPNTFAVRSLLVAREPTAATTTAGDNGDVILTPPTSSLGSSSS